MLGPAWPIGTMGGMGAGLGIGIGVNTGVGVTIIGRMGCTGTSTGVGTGIGAGLGGICGGSSGAGAGAGAGRLSGSGVRSGTRPFCLWIWAIWSSTEMFWRAALAAASAVPEWPSQEFFPGLAAGSSSPILLPMLVSCAASSPTPKMSVRRSASRFRLDSMLWPGA